MQPQIIEITPEQTLAIRHKVMWQDKPIDYVCIAEDDQGMHYGLFLDDKMISVISLFITNQEAQFRKFATLHEYQGQGFGAILLQEIMDIVAQKKLHKVWCNARIEKSTYYAKFGLIATDKQFTKGGIEYIIMEKIFSS